MSCILHPQKSRGWLGAQVEVATRTWVRRSPGAGLGGGLGAGLGGGLGAGLGGGLGGSLGARPPRKWSRTVRPRMQISQKGGSESYYPCVIFKNACIWVLWDVPIGSPAPGESWNPDSRLWQLYSIIQLGTVEGMG